MTGYYTDMAGNMLSFPFNSSTPILYYNKALFKAAGLDENNPQRHGRKWKTRRARCGLPAPPVVSPRIGRLGFTSRIFPPFIMFRSQPVRTGWPGSTRS